MIDHFGFWSLLVPLLVPAIGLVAIAWFERS